MLAPDEWIALVSHCLGHPVAVCPTCSASVQAFELGVEIVGGRRDFCPRCRADLTAVLRRHLMDCPRIRGQERKPEDRH
jgi:hypothetical protein